ncbi:ABC transporter ATP-binding protein [Celeribacter baekdonensis]|uniref:ABC transporter ATP-binding protein n=1 Tax=Celeribacter baekdonensis TaxID=875171 RepID=UPI0030D9A90F|tara:strand:- start:263963 stop:265048 length:1086 start_codon:yes stop_codon:yes gene_type:complete
MLELQGVSKIVAGKPHINATDLIFQKGTMNVLLGPTSAGKTSLMRLMAGLDRPSTGKVFWNGKDVTGQRVQDRRIAMVYQQFINYPSMSVYNNIASPLRLAGCDQGEIDKRVRETAAMLQLTPLLDRMPLELSGGQQQRCALARALVKEAGLVLLDEPLANLDYKLREELRDEIPRIFRESGAIFVYATTEPEEALLLGGNTACLWEGRVTQFGPATEVYRHPIDTTTARVFSDPPMNFSACTKAGGTLTFEVGSKVAASGNLSTVRDGDYVAGFRPNHLRFEKPNGPALELTCQLVASEITGSETFLHLRQGASRWVALVHGIHHLTDGTDVCLWLSTAHFHLFDTQGQLAVQAAYAAAA